jgi:hypothetical protein
VDASPQAGSKSASFSNISSTETKLAHEKLGFIAVHDGEFHPCGTLLFAMFASGISAIVYDEEIQAPCLGGEMSSGGLLGHIEADEGLPAGAEVMFSRATEA